MAFSKETDFRTAHDNSSLLDLVFVIHSLWNSVEKSNKYTCVLHFNTKANLHKFSWSLCSFSVLVGTRLKKRLWKEFCHAFWLYRHTFPMICCSNDTLWSGSGFGINFIWVYTDRSRHTARLQTHSSSHFWTGFWSTQCWGCHQVMKWVNLSWVSQEMLVKIKYFGAQVLLIIHSSEVNVTQIQQYG